VHHSITGATSGLVTSERFVGAREVRFTPDGAAASRQVLRWARKRPTALQQKYAYSITSSARESKVGGSSMPSVFAACRLITKL
jgi:hypothetical protein